MKKIIVFFVIIIAIVCIIGIQYYSYKADYNLAVQENRAYDQYKDKEVYGLDVASLINKAVDENTKNKIEQTEDGEFIQNDKNSIEIEIYMKDNEKTYKMETIHNNGTEQFVQYYSNIKFKCSKIEYHKSTNRVKYILFEQI